jgi:hypothetical protein
VIITWLEANTASLVGPGAAAALSEFLQAHEKDKDVNEFLKAALAWRISQDLGTQHNTQAALHAWQENLKLIEERRQLHHSPGSSPTRDVVVTPTAV